MTPGRAEAAAIPSMGTPRPTATGHPVIAALDGREHDADVLALARTLQVALGGELLIAHVIPPPPLGHGATGYAITARRDGRELLARATEQSPTVTATRLLETWPPAFALRQLAADHDASMLVVGSSHRGAVGSVVPGRTASQLVARADCLIGVASDGFARTAASSAPVGVAYDATAEADRALADAIVAGSRLGVPLRLYHVVHEVSEDASWELVRQNVQRIAGETLDRGLRQVPDGVSASGVTLQGEVAARIAESAQADGIQLLFVGSRGYGPVHEALVGGVVGGLLHAARCPLVIAPGRRRRRVGAPHGDESRGR
jgi:nucleotide-binding universal stress UspA family protein